MEGLKKRLTLIISDQVRFPTSFSLLLGEEKRPNEPRDFKFWASHWDQPWLWQEGRKGTGWKEKNLAENHSGSSSWKTEGETMFSVKCTTVNLDIPSLN